MLQNCCEAYGAVLIGPRSLVSQLKPHGMGQVQLRQQKRYHVLLSLILSGSIASALRMLLYTYFVVAEGVISSVLNNAYGHIVVIKGVAGGAGRLHKVYCLFVDGFMDYAAWWCSDV